MAKKVQELTGVKIFMLSWAAVALLCRQREITERPKYSIKYSSTCCRVMLVVPFWRQLMSAWHIQCGKKNVIVAKSE